MPYFTYNGKMITNSSGKYLTRASGIFDYDGNEYTTVTIGTQTWLVENLLTTHYNNGVPINHYTTAQSASWAADTSGAYDWYNSDEGTYKDPYGALYNWFAIDNPNGLAPTGTRVATKADWDTLNTYLGGSSVAGGKLKEAGFAHWNSPNTGATNETGFTALPGGYKGATGTFFVSINVDGLWWADFESGNNGQRYYMQSGSATLQGDTSLDKNFGMSIRCIVE